MIKFERCSVSFFVKLTKEQSRKINHECREPFFSSIHYKKLKDAGIEDLDFYSGFWFECSAENEKQAKEAVKKFFAEYF